MRAAAIYRRRQMKKLMLTTVLPAIVLAVVIGLAGRRDKLTPTPPSTTTVVATEPTKPAPPAKPVEREPVYEEPSGLYGTDAENEAGAKVVDAAMRAVYARCSKFYAFREGSTIGGTYVFRKSKKTPERVNVEVKLASPSRASGNTLFYMVTFAKGEPKEITPLKQISADMCGLAEADVAEAL